MLLVLILFLAVSSVALFFLKRDRQTIYLLGLCYSFLCLSIGMTVCLSKVGGLSPEQKSFLFLDTQIQLWLSYRMFPFWKWGYMIVLGWYLFPTFLLLTAMYYSMVPAVLRFRKNSWMVFILPAISLAVSYSAFFPRLAKSGLALPTLLMKLSAVWVYGYMTVAVILLVYEYRDIIMPYNKRQFRYIMVFILCVAVQYMVYGMQGAIPIYRIYSAESMPLNGWLYADFLTDMRGLYLFSLFTLISVLLGVWNLKNYMVADWKKNREETSIYRKSDTARMGVTVFVHSIKNQLLSNRVLCKKIRKELAGEYPDQKKLEEYAHMLEEVNESMLGRMEELYKSTKLNYISLCPMTARQIVDTTLKLFHKKYPEVQVKISGKMEGSLLADEQHLGEALYNLLTNAHEAFLMSEKDKEVIELEVYCKDIYLGFEIRDNGKGISKPERRRIFDPFYTDKNTNFNWGMGLYYVREIVKGHLGNLRLESYPGEGTSFFVMIPRYEPGKAAKKYRL